MPYPNPCLFGEVLFDVFPDGRRVLGGAPFNVAWHLAAFGAGPRFISAAGADPDGERIRADMEAWGLDTSGLQTDPEHPTGRVRVSLVDGEPSYAILPERAYDFIRAPMDSGSVGLLYHGTLALRGPVSASTLLGLKRGIPDLVFLDVNLRDPWWTLETTLGLVTDADWVKLNRDELVRLSAGEAGASAWPLPDLARRFLERHALSGLVVTLGGEGAFGLTPEGGLERVAPAPALEVVDTVGAGDAFTAVILLGLLQGWPLATTLARAQTFASRIVARRGATGTDRALYQPFLDHWGLDTY
ncbi:carbohydrate kinase family protein [Thiocystis violacea]|uniref:carbohydrate kinase family protein n=1 Tax=Thiocystis violacea TaxID=13725 RepID=UPI001904CA97|nr:carbohydrate kinase [Thiocystis violacea]MBK1719051.1 carbohydrate kinase [Thiocystis violacea]